MQSEARGGPPRGASTRSRGYPRGARGSTRGTRGAYRARASIRGSSGLTRGITYPARQPRGSFVSKTWRKPVETTTQHATSNWQERYATLEESRKRERANAIRHGLIADPDKPRTLAEAITPLGTCQDMCAEFERVQRVVQKDVWKEETDPSYPATDRVPDEKRMVKKFRRAAAGIEEQLPSDLRPPHILKQTCDYLFNEVIGQAEHLAKVHHFVWDRTRAIRNDLSIQQLTKPEDVSIAIECYERIARFHIVSLHQLALAEKPYDKYDWQQEREQLDKALVSLMEYYEDNRGKLQLPNEVEFRAYCIIFELKNSTPDIEDRIQSWPQEIAQHPRVRKARELYAAACTTNDLQGPLKPRTQHAIAQQDWHKFWRLIESRGVSYLMGCVAEIYFNFIRGIILQALLKSASAKVLVQWDIEHIRHALAFDHEEEVEEFCDRYGLIFKNVNGQLLLDFSVFPNKQLPDPKPTATKQSKSFLVEQKRWNRTLPAVINGLSTKEARLQGLIEEDLDEMQDVDAMNGEIGTADASSDDGLFVSEAKSSAPTIEAPSIFNQASTADGLLAAPSVQASAASGFGKPSASLFPQPNGTGKTASVFAPAALSTFGQPSASPFAPVAASAFAFGKQSPFAATSISFGKPSASPFASASTIEQSSDTPTTQPPASTLGRRSASPFAPAATQPTKSTFGQQSASPFAPTEASPFAPAAVSTFGKPSASPFAPATASTSQTAPSPASALDPATTTDKVPKSPLSKADKPTFSFSKTTEQIPAKASISGAPSVLENAIAATAEIKSGFDFRQPSKPAADNAQSSAKAPASPFKFPSNTSGISTSTQQQANGPGLFAPARSPGDVATAPATSFASGVPQVVGHGTKSTTAESAPSKITQQHPTPSPSTSRNDNKIPSAAKLDQQQSISTTHPESLHSPVSQAATQSRANGTSFTPSQTKAVTPHSAPQKKEPDLHTILDQAAKHLTLDEGTGYLKQFVDFALSQIVNEVQEKVYFERIEQEATEYRASKVAERYGIYWRSLCRRRRLARQGREQRERAFRRMRENKSQQSAASSVVGSTSSAGGKRAKYGHTHSNIEAVDRMFQQSVNSGRWAKMAADAKKQSASNHNAPSESADGSGHDSSNSFTRIDRNGRIVKPGTQSPASNGFIRSIDRSAATSATTPLRNTTRTSYFRRKALGIERDVDESPVRSNKRAYSEMSAASHHASSPLSSPAITPDIQHDMIVPSQALTKVQKTTAEDDALFARVRAAKQRLAEGTMFYREEIAKAQSPQSHTLDTAPYNSPSLERARIEARERRAQEHGAEIPAYRLRESKFVARDSYIDSVVAARKIIEARSAAASRPESRMTDYSPAVAAIDGTNGLKSVHEDCLSIPEPTAQSVVQTLASADHFDQGDYDGVGIEHRAEVNHDTNGIKSVHEEYLSNSETTAQHATEPLPLPGHLGEEHFDFVDDKDVDQNGRYVNGAASATSPAIPDRNTGYSHNNPFALLQDVDEEHDVEDQSEEDEDEEFEHDTENVVGRRFSVEEDYDDGEIEYGDDENEDGELEDYSDEEEEEDEDDDDDDEQSSRHYLTSRQMQHVPEANEALQAIGHNEDDAIELSD
ncbi:hypothetical protein AMS68_005102 [Peltaster fructicola]|uniref:SAC3/GANP/THP3 conserved domain-containing protein n=1 Tax=Peltaster fructicola TaxID=286661 RepID=A0A6H0XY49_9PEZI|nr:hypothetical protein AMS68_005102 [Peltaster fructicola]